MPYWKRITLAAFAYGVAGCVTTGSHFAPAGSSDTITGEEIAASTTTNVWDLLRRRAAHYTYVEDSHGRAVAITTQRGRSSFSIPNADVATVIIDGARLTDFVTLQMMSTEDVDHIDLLDSVSGTALHGTNSGAGVIYIHTRLADSGHA